MKAYIKTNPEFPTLKRPAHSGDAGCDLIAYSDPVIVGETKTPKSKLYSSISYIEYDTNVTVAPENESQYFSLIYPRSSISKYNLSLANSVGVVDSGYRDTIKVRFRYIWQPKDMTLNSAEKQKEGSQFFVRIDPSKIYQKGDKIAQLVWASHNKLYMEFTESLPMSDRGYGGFGSTGQ
jgi:dUTP pyrophosphatase|tara:strand:- start:280 stop:816 length:537 start_codon:yes stop_codon:yes gene_type:complete